MPRGNINNLIPNSELTPEQRKERAKKAGQKSGEVRAQRKLLKDELLFLLDEKIKGGDYAGKTTREAMSARLVDRAVNGDTDAYKIIRDTIGEKPTEKIQMGADEETIEKMEAFFDFLKDMVNNDN